MRLSGLGNNKKKNQEKSWDRNDNIERKQHWLVDYNNNEHKWDIMMVSLIPWIIIDDN